MSDQRSRVLAARWVIPVNRPPIHGGWVRIKGSFIVEVGSGEPPGPASNLGDVAILPGLVNAHTHLEFSHISEPVGQPGISLTDWIGLVVAARGDASETDRESSIRLGIEELIGTGTVLAGEISTPPCQYPRPSHELELVAFAEVIGLSPERYGERLEAAGKQIAANEWAACSPHAPYSTAPAAIDAAVDLASRNDRPLAMHVAESPAERELLANGSGQFAGVLKSMGVWRPGLFPWDAHPFDQLISRLATAPSALLVHGNDFNRREIQLLTRHSNVTVVYCPRTHRFFGYDRHPVAELLASGVRVALGTDSRASNPDLSLWNEVQFLLRHRPDLEPQSVVRMATLNGAQALRHSKLGAIEKGYLANLGTVDSLAENEDRLYEDLALGEYQRIKLQHEGQMQFE